MLVIAGVLTHVGRKNGCLRVLQLCEWYHMIWSPVWGRQELRGNRLSSDNCNSYLVALMKASMILHLGGNKFLFFLFYVNTSKLQGV